MSRTVDVATLPRWALGQRSTIWWGVVFLVCIEGTMFALLAASYLYLRGNFEVWPPTGVGRQTFDVSLAGLVMLLVSVWPMWLTSRAARDNQLRRARTMLVLATVLGLGFMATRWLECLWMPFRWDDHAYGSVVWATIGMHTLHGIASSVENVMFLVLLCTKHVQQRHRTDLQVNAVYWYFVVFAWLPLWALIYFEGIR
jgi:cytochrome c oxidase subunit 3